jgi:hypothetical protein
MTTFTQETDVKALLGISETIPAALLTQADVWVQARMKAGLIDIPTPVTDEMKLAGAYICAAMFIDSKASNKSWNQSVSIGGASFTGSDIAEKFRKNAEDLIGSIIGSTANDDDSIIFEAVLYNEDPYEYYP